MNWGLINCPSDSDTIIKTLNEFRGKLEVTICELGIGNGNTGNRIVDFLKSIGIPKIQYFGIDACHCADCVHHDALAASNMVNQNGFMAFHDTSLLWQYPHNTKKESYQHYESGQQIRPLNVVEGIISSRSLWNGEWELFLQTGDELPWGGMRVYKKLI